MRVVGRCVLAVAAVSSLAAPIFACWVGGVDFLLLVGQGVLLPGTLALILWSFGVLVGACLIVIVVGHRRVRVLELRGRHVFFAGILAVTLVGTGIWCVGQALVVEGLESLGKYAYTVLRAPDAGGCVLIAHEFSTLRTTNGQIYAVNGLGYAEPVGSWDADEIELLVRDGTYSLSWSGEAGTISLAGSRAVTPKALQLTCPR